jgi:hypothetical protein
VADSGQRIGPCGHICGPHDTYCPICGIVLDEQGRVRHISGSRVEDVLRVHAEVQRMAQEQASTGNTVIGSAQNIVQAGTIHGVHFHVSQQPGDNAEPSEVD